MASGLAALLDDIATIAKVAAASIDDIGAAAGKAGAKAAGVVIDDTAVTPRYVTGFTPDRELPVIAKIAKGSLVNKIAIILPVALLLSYFLPWAITPILMLGGAYLCFEGAEKVLEEFREEVTGEGESLAEEVAVLEAVDHEKDMVPGAVRASHRIGVRRAAGPRAGAPRTRSSTPFRPARGPEPELGRVRPPPPRGGGRVPVRRSWWRPAWEQPDQRAWRPVRMPVPGPGRAPRRGRPRGGGGPRGPPPSRRRISRTRRAH